MAKESLITDALKTAGLSAAEKAAKKGVTAIRQLPKGKQNKVAGVILFVATVVFLVLAAKRLRTRTE